jgi:ABC transporter substrate binding protein
MPIVGFVNSGSSVVSWSNAFRKGLNETGYIEGQNVTVEYHWLEGQFDRLPSVMADLVRRQVAVIATPAGNYASQAAKAATATIPVVFSVGEDPVKLGLVASLARPGGNLTGINFFSAELAAKRLQLLRELVPAAARIAVLVDPANATSTESSLRGVECSLCRHQSLLARPARPIGPIGDTPGGSRNVSRPPTYRGRRADKLRSQHCGRLSSGRSLHRPHPQGREACGVAGRAVDQIRARHQRLDRQDARPHRAADTARHRRRGDRIGLPLLQRICRLVARPGR